MDDLCLTADLYDLLHRAVFQIEVLGVEGGQPLFPLLHLERLIEFFLKGLFPEPPSGVVHLIVVPTIDQPTYDKPHGKMVKNRAKGDGHGKEGTDLGQCVCNP